MAHKSTAPPQRDGPAERIIHGARDGIDDGWGTAKAKIDQAPAAGNILDIANIGNRAPLQRGRGR
jgi:hypothetical protein